MGGSRQLRCECVNGTPLFGLVIYNNNDYVVSAVWTLMTQTVKCFFWEIIHVQETRGIKQS